MPIKLSCTTNPNINDKSGLSFAQCSYCYTIQLDEMIPLSILYSESHNYTSVGKVWENYFNLFCMSIQDIVNNKNVLEIGDPSAKIATKLNNYNKWYIIEPNKNNNIILKNNIEFIEGFFDNNFHTDKKIDVIIHSHLFEHTYDPNNFLKKCNDVLVDNGEMFFGVPNMEYIATQEISPFLGVFFEHTIFLNKDNIRHLLRANGFDIIDIIDYENHSILFHARKNTTSLYGETIIHNFYDSFFITLNKYNEFVNTCNEIIKGADKKVYLFGASYNTQFLLALGLHEEKIDGILDNSTDKQNKYLYGYDLKIYSPEIIMNNDSIVILKNGYYCDEIKKQLLCINPNTIIIE
uniref:C-methyltransferase domain-containing protein n=1 Tax=viral metagenome TaxID=1070528 RepID=A0A6C0K3F0_9ZZZZ